MPEIKTTMLKGKEFKLKEIELRESSKTEGELYQVVFTTDKDKQITYKPKKEEVTSTTIKGIKATRTIRKPVMIYDLDDKIVAISRLIEKDKTVSIKGDVTKMDTMNQLGEPVVYLFIQDRDFDGWEIEGIDKLGEMPESESSSEGKKIPEDEVEF